VERPANTYKEIFMRTKKFVLTILGMLAGIITAGTGISAAEYDLEAYLKRVEHYNLDIAYAHKGLETAKQNTVQARSALLPSIGVQGAYTRNLQDVMQSTPVAADLSSGRIIRQDADSNYDNEFTLGIGITQKLFDASAMGQYNQARKGTAVQEQTLEALRRNLRNNAKKNVCPDPTRPFGGCNHGILGKYQRSNVSEY
jgi:outer membrane protein TolC